MQTPVPLHIHSNFSLLQGVSTIQAITEHASKLGISALAITDIDSMQGVVSFAKTAQEFQIKPILGTCLLLGSLHTDYVICLAKNESGFAAFCKLITQKKLIDSFSVKQLVESFTKDLIYITPSMAIFTSLPISDNVYYEQHTFTTTDFANTLPYNRVVLTTPILFLEPKDFFLHKIVAAIRERKTIDSIPHELLASEQSSFQAAEQHNYSLYPEQWILNSYVIAAQCNCDLKLGEYKFPTFKTGSSETTLSLLHRLCIDGLQQRYKSPDKKIFERLHKELEIIADLNFVDYFLVVWDIVKEAKRRGMMMIGRGSAANSLVSYCLGFTEVDPMYYNLYFERFLNRSRTSPPDVDLDFSWKERDEIVKYVFEKYGYERVAMISTIITFRARSAFRETAKVFGYSDAQISEYSKFIPWTSAKNLEHLPELFPEARQLHFDDERLKRVLHYATKLAGYPRHLSIHPSGIVISPDPITNYTALDYAKNKGLGIIVTQPDMYAIEELGLVKIDLLSQRSLGVLRTTLGQLE